MMTIVNHGEEIVSNLFVIGVTIVLLPGFLNAVEMKKVALIRLEAYSLLFLAIISIVRLINRIYNLPDEINASIVLVAVILGVLLLFTAIARLMKRNNLKDK
jgi:TctA family transporter